MEEGGLGEAIETIEAIDISKLQSHQHHDDPSTLLRHLHHSIHLYAHAFRSHDFRSCDAAVDSLLALLDRVAELALSNPEATGTALVVLREVRRIIADSTQVDLEGIYLALPKVVAKYAGVSEECRLMVGEIISLLLDTESSPRDMLTSLCEALDCLGEAFTSPVYFIPLFSGLSKALSLVKRSHFKIVKEVVPVVLNVLNITSVSSDTEREPSKELVGEAVRIAAAMEAVSQLLDGGSKDDVLALLGLYLLQTMASVTRINLSLELNNCTSFMRELSAFLSVCNLSYLGLITGSDVDRIIDVVSRDEDDDYMKSDSIVKQGACISVIWAYISYETAQDTKECFDAFIQKLRSSQTTTWQALGMLSFVIDSMDQSWEIKDHALDFLLHVIDEEILQSCDKEESLCYLISMFNTVQAIQKLMIFAFDGALRKKSFLALKKVLAYIPSSHRFDLLKALIEKSDSPSMIALLLDIAKAEVHSESSRSSNTTLNGEVQTLECDKHSPMSSSVLELVELILKPPKGGSPCLQENVEAVVAALNLYRYLLISTSTGQFQNKVVLLEANLRKAYSEWLLPLRSLVSAIEAENRNNSTAMWMHISCTLNPLELVLYRCIELVEEHLKRVA